MFNFAKKLVSAWPLLLLISTFGPYISPDSGIKIDSIVIYLTLLLAVIRLLLRPRIEINIELLVIFYLWLSVFLYLVTLTLLNKGYLNIYAFLAEIDNFLQPLAIIFSFLVLIYKKDLNYISMLLKKSCLILILLLSVNTLWIFLGFNFDLSHINQYFVRGVAQNAATLGRFTGVFNQPIEAGIAYSIGLFSWLYLISKRIVKLNIKYIIALLLLIIGGAINVSKAFIFGGLIIFTINLLKKFTILRKVLSKTLVVIVLLSPILFFLINRWEGLTYLSRLFYIGNYQKYGLIYFITAGRYGGKTSQQRFLFQKVWQISPLFGLGMGSQRIYDSAFFHFFSSGGIIALLVYLLILIFLFLYGWKFFSVKNCREEAILLFDIILIIIFSSFGVPVLTINRVSVIIWVYICILFWYVSKIENCKDYKKNLR
ncbi:hypothetical protein L1766_01530 [Thermovorax subterraneus]|nr:hypothetical protein [Thermovorax subterraneus]